MDQALNDRIDPGKGPEIDEPGDDGRHHLVDLVVLFAGNVETPEAGVAALRAFVQAQQT
jgi:hypothetical protein